MATAASTALGVSGRRAVATRQATLPLCRLCEKPISRSLRTASSHTSAAARFHTAPVPTSATGVRTSISRQWGTRRPANAILARAQTTASAVNDEGGPKSNSKNELLRELASITDMLDYLTASTDKVLSHTGIPSEQDVAAALLACREIADLITDESMQNSIAHMVVASDSAASGLLSLDQGSAETMTQKPHQLSNANNASSRMAKSIASTPAEMIREKVTEQIRKVVDHTSQTAYAVMRNERVFITPSLLEDYVGVQARLGRPETLPDVFHMYASKPMASQDGSSSIQYTKQNPHSLKNAIEPKVIDQALDVAIEAKNLDAAVGIVENGYATKAFVRAKIARQALPPAAAFAATPVAAYALASNLSGMQDAMDAASATNIAFAGILAYVGFTASIGVVALTTANDQMRRVTWTPGVPLRKRWAREDQRAAMDKIACAWGFRETWRQGEEEGPQWAALQQFLGTKGMLLDRTDLMEGFD